jgi:hypothetical protein
MPSPPGSVTMIWSAPLVPVTVSVDPLTVAVVAQADGATASVANSTAIARTDVRLTLIAPERPRRDQSYPRLPAEFPATLGSSRAGGKGDNPHPECVRALSSHRFRDLGRFGALSVTLTFFVVVWPFTTALIVTAAFQDLRFLSRDRRFLVSLDRAAPFAPALSV